MGQQTLRAGRDDFRNDIRDRDTASFDECMTSDENLLCLDIGEANARMLSANTLSDDTGESNRPIIN